MRRLVGAAFLLCTLGCAPSFDSTGQAGLAGLAQDRPAPRSLEEFKTAVQKVLTDTGVPGAGIALVRQSGVEWAGGVGFADRDRKTPVTADTHFRAGSISKTFVAMALVQLSEDGDLDLDSPVASLAPQVEIDNRWDDTDPVRVIHLLQHTAGFDDMHFNEMYNLDDPADMSLEEVLRINPRSRVVRWRPGTRMSYSNPGYAVAAYVLEQVTGEKYEDVIASKIFDPIGMTTSSFRLNKEDEQLLARGYRSNDGPPVAYPQIYLRPSGNLHTSPAELGKFVHVLLNWGELGDTLVVDPEYSSNMEHPRTTLASRAGLHDGYGSGIAAHPVEPFPLLGHDGGIEGFSSQYVYSTSRDAGFVVLLNATFSRQAMDRISDLAIRYLKLDVEPPAKPRAKVATETLRQYEGYYQPAAPRIQATAFLERLVSGSVVSVSGDGLSVTPALVGPARQLIPTADNQFRLDNEVAATRIFTPDADGVMVMTGPGAYAERVSRFEAEIIRWPVLVSAAIVLTPLAMILIWLALIRARPGFWMLKLSLLMCAIGFALPIAGAYNVNESTLGLMNPATMAMFAGTWIVPVGAVLALSALIHAWINEAGGLLRAYAILVILAASIVSVYVAWWGMIGFRPWSF